MSKKVEGGGTFEGPFGPPHPLGPPPPFSGEAKFGLVTVGERGQMVIPKDLREMLGIKTGDKMAVIANRRGGRGGFLILFNAKVLREKLKSFFGANLEELLK